MGRADPVHGEVFRYLYLGDKHGGEPFTEHDLALVRVLATEAGIALANARLHEAARQRERWIDRSVAVTTAPLSGRDIGSPSRSSPTTTVPASPTAVDAAASET